MQPTPEQQAVDSSTSSTDLRILAQTSIALARLVATNPSADPELLRELSQHNDAMIRQGLTSNPNTPIEILLDFGITFPEELLNNPIFTLLLLENPALFDEMSIELLRSIAQHPNTPIDVLVECSLRLRDSALLLNMLMRSEIPQHLLDRLMQSSDPDVAEAARFHINASSPGEVSDAIVQFLNDARHLNAHRVTLQALAASSLIPFDYVKLGFVENCLQKIASSPRTSAQILEALAQVGDCLPIEIFNAIATNPNLPDSIAEQMIQAQNPHIWMAFAKSSVPNILQTLAERTCRDSIEPQMMLCLRRFSTALCDALGKEGEFILQQALQDSPDLFDLLRQSAGANLPETLFPKLDWTADPKFRELLQYAQQQKRFETVIKGKIAEIQFWKNAAIETTQAIAANPNTPIYILEKLSRDRRAIYTERGDRGSSVQAMLLENPNVPPFVLENFATHQSAWVRSKVASHPNLSPRWLERMVEDEDLKVQMAVASNPNTPLPILERMIRETFTTDPYDQQSNRLNLGILFAQSNQPRQPGENRQLRSTALKNPSLPTERLDEFDLELSLSGEDPFISHPNVSEELLARRLAKSDDEWMQQQIAQNPATPGYLLETIFERTTRQQTLEAIAHHPKTFEAILTKLSATPQDIHKYALPLSQNPNLPLQIWEKLLRSSLPNSEPEIILQFLMQYPEQIALVLERYANSKSAIARFMALMHPEVPLTQLETASRSLHWTDRYAVAQNINLPTSTISRLAEDANYFVRSAARQATASKNSDH